MWYGHNLKGCPVWDGHRPYVGPGATDCMWTSSKFQHAVYIIPPVTTESGEGGVRPNRGENREPSTTSQIGTRPEQSGAALDDGKPRTRTHCPTCYYPTLCPRPSLSAVVVRAWIIPSSIGGEGPRGDESDQALLRCALSSSLSALR
jgi:hypothetical protein